MKKKWIFLCVMFLLLTGCSAGTKKLRFGAAGLGGVYHIFADTFANVLSTENNDFQIDVKTTAGSAANLRLLSEGYIQLAVAQADLLHDAWNGDGNFADRKTYQGYGAVAALYTEACQIVVREDSSIISMDDLLGKTVSIGEEESGTEQNAGKILAASGLTDQMLTEVNLNYTDAAEQLKDGRIDAFFCTAGVETTVISELAKQCGVRLLSLDEKTLNKLTRSYDFYSEYLIPAGTYEGQEEETRTLGVKAVLLASDRLSSAQVKEITKTLFDNKEKVQYALPVDISLDETAALEGITVPFHKGAAAYYEDCGVALEDGTEKGSK